MIADTLVSYEKFENGKRSIIPTLSPDNIELYSSDREFTLGKLTTKLIKLGENGVIAFAGNALTIKDLAFELQKTYDQCPADVPPMRFIREKLNLAKESPNFGSNFEGLGASNVPVCCNHFEMSLVPQSRNVPPGH